MQDLCLSDYSNYQELDGHHIKLTDFGRITDAIASTLQKHIKFNKHVQEINYDAENENCRVQIKCIDGEEYLADVCLVTVCILEYSYRHEFRESIPVFISNGLLPTIFSHFQVPLGVLKHEKLLFKPLLSTKKRRSIQKLGFGCVNKVEKHSTA